MSQLDGSISGILVLGGSILRTPPQKKAQIKSDGLNFFAKYKKELQMTIAVLGTEYEIKKESYEKDELFEKRHIDGYCDDIKKVIVVCDMKTHPLLKEEEATYCAEIEKQITRHEIIHAFLSESGLQECTSGGAWSKNEAMVDWIALQFPKILAAFKAARCL